MSDGKMVHVHLLDQANERELALQRELAQVKAGWAEDDARLQRAEEGWAEASEQLAQVKAERDRLQDELEAAKALAHKKHLTAEERNGMAVGFGHDLAVEVFGAKLEQAKAERDEARELLAGWPDARVSKAEVERDTALRHLEDVLDLGEPTGSGWATFEAARAFLLSMREKADQ